MGSQKSFMDVLHVSTLSDAPGSTQLKQITSRLVRSDRDAGAGLAGAREVGHELGVGGLDDLQLGLLAAARLGQLVAVVAQALVHAALACAQTSAV